MSLPALEILRLFSTREVWVDPGFTSCIEPAASHENSTKHVAYASKGFGFIDIHD